MKIRLPMRPVSFHPLKVITILILISTTGYTLSAAPVSMREDAPLRDSLEKVLERSTDPIRRLRLSVDLADLARGDRERETGCWDRTLGEAQRAGNEYILKTALDYLVTINAWSDPDAATTYVDTARLLLPGSRHALFRASLHAYSVYTKMQLDHSASVVTAELERFESVAPERMGSLERIEWEFLTGLAFDFSAEATGSQADIKNAIPHIERTIELLGDYPLDERLHFERLCRQELSDLYMIMDDPRAADQIKQMLDLHQRWIAMNTDTPRPYFDDTYFPLFAYAKMIYIGNLLSREELDASYASYQELIRRTRNFDPAESYDTSARYYQFAGDYPKAIRYIDSMLLSRRSKNAHIPYAAYALQSRLYEKIGDYRNALRTLRTYNDLKQETDTEKNRTALAEIQALYDFNALQLEKTRLADRNKFFALVGSCLLALLLAAWAVYETVMRRRLRRMHKRLLDANREIVRQSEKAAESERMKTEFLNSMCHEIRTPLNAITGFSSLVLDPSVDTASKAEFGSLIRSNTRELIRLVDNMLELSQLASSEAPLCREPVDLADLCRREANAVAKRCSAAGIDLRVEEPNENSTVYSHPFYLSRVLGHLLDNAIKFTPRGGGIVLACHKEESHAVLSVTDTGTGVAPGKEEWIFERFAKLDPFKPGTGLGLYSCRLIVNRLGGRIALDASSRKGCRIVVRIPLYGCKSA